MSCPIEDYAMLADCQSAALVSRSGSIDWLCLPRFDSESCFAALLGKPGDGRWLLAPAGPVRRKTRRYLDETIVLETTHETAEGAVTVTDLMPIRDKTPDVVRVVRGERGRVRMRMELIIRFAYGSAVPWVTAIEGGIQAIAGPDRLRLVTPVKTRGEGLSTVAEFEVGPGESVPFVLTWSPSHLPPPAPVDPEAALAETVADWRGWASRCTYKGPHAKLVMRSLLTLKALTYAPTGGIAAAATTSLPEWPGGVRNWDYRFCWLRDATFTLLSLLSAGYSEEAAAWCHWLLRAAAGAPAQLQIMYGIAGERRLPELTLPWLSGYEDSRPVRVGNAASDQLQLDVYGEVTDALYQARRAGLEHGVDAAATWALQCALVRHLEKIRDQPDEGIWEVRGPRRHFTHSKVMAWVAFDRAVKCIEQSGLEGSVERWRQIRDEIHASVCSKGFDPQLGSFVQSYGSKDLDASLLMLPLVGFLPATDPRMRGTVAAIEATLLRDGLVARYTPHPAVDGLPPGEGTFLPCSFWLADNYTLQGRHREAQELFDRLAGLANDVGLLAEEYDPVARRQLGNFPQAFSHVSLINTALALGSKGGPVEQRQQ
ncbi:MAG TPA: glycoside hydrolase family 15 protein [Myxococcales bacterium]|nr:glycoside hydrolase family 15 protein [Myxococcales bacterium]